MTIFMNVAVAGYNYSIYFNMSLIWKSYILYDTLVLYIKFVRRLHILYKGLLT